MELRHLRYLVGVVDAGGVHPAARRLNLSQPTLTRQLHDLQTDLGVRLFARVGRRLVLTDEGQEMLRLSRRLLGDVDALRERARALGDGVSPLRVGAPQQLMEHVLPRVVARYRRRHPAVQIMLVEEGTDRLVPLVEEGALDLAIGVLQKTERVRRLLLYPFCLLAIVP